MNFRELAIKYQAEAVERLQNLLKIKSVYDPQTIGPNAPFGAGIQKALETFLDMAKSDGFKVINDDGYAGCIEYGEGEESVAVLCHLDVVPEGNNWLHGPYDATISNGRIYARGAMDDKGPTMASYYGLKILKDAGVKLNKKIQLILGTDEESGWGGVTHYFAHYPMPEIGFAPDADFPLIYGEKGICHIDFNVDAKINGLISFHGGERYNVVIDKADAVTSCDLQEVFKIYLQNNNLNGICSFKDGYYHYQIKGTSAHAMEPMKGVNAGTYLADFLSNYINHPALEFIKKYNHLDFHLTHFGTDYQNEQMGRITCNIGIIDIENGHARFTWDIRYPIGFDYHNFLSVLEKTTADYKVNFRIDEHKTPLFVDPSDPLVQTLYAIYVEHTGDTVNKPCTIGGGTYARMLKKGVAFGMEKPGGQSLAHQPNEYIEIDEFTQAIAIYAEAIAKLGM